MNPRNRNRLALLACSVLIMGAGVGRAEVIVQFFETEWDELYQRLPEISEIGYEGIWHPSPTKSPVAGVFPNGYGGNVGYNLFDRFDLGEHPQRGTRRTRYGTRGSLRNFVDTAHQSNIKIYPDLVFNHSGNGPHIDTYPGMRYYDFHGWDNPNEPFGFQRAPRMFDYTPDSGDCDPNFYQELVSLFDIVTEIDNRFSVGGYCGVNMVVPGVEVRQPGQYETYPFHNPGDPLPAEHPVEFLERWVNWLGYAMDYDGARLDAPKHVVREFFGEPGDGFLHEIQWNFDNRRGNSDPVEYDEMYRNDIHRDDALLFGEMFIFNQGEVDYWRTWNGGLGPDNGQGVKMRYLDFPLLKQMMQEAFNNGNMAALNNTAAFGNREGVTFVHSHDEDSIDKKDLAYAYALTHIGVPVVYTTGNNYDPNDQGNNNWLLIGYESATGEYNNDNIPNLVYVHNQFARGFEWTRSDPFDNDVFAYERFEDLDGDGNTVAPDIGESLMLVGLNDSGLDRTRTFTVAFEPGTVLNDYTGNAGPVTVFDDFGTPKVTVTVPGLGGEGFVAYAPFNATANGDPLRFRENGSAAGTIDWELPKGKRLLNVLRSVTRLTNDTVEIDVHFTEPAGTPAETVNSVMVKVGRGLDVDGDTVDDDTGKSLVSGGYEGATEIAPGHWRLTADLSNVPDGLHLIKARCFNGRPADKPALFQTFNESVYVDRSGPAIDVVNLAPGETVDGDRVIEISNPDKTAGWIEVRVDAGAYETAHEIMKGTWKYTIQGLAPGPHTVEILAHEYDFGTPRTEINRSTLSRSFTVADTSGMTLTMNHPEGTTQFVPFFETSGSVGPGTLTLLWDGYELDNLAVDAGTYSQFFTGAYTVGGSSEFFTGAFVNGPHFFEAILDDGAGNVKVLSRTVFFNLYNKANDPNDWNLAYDSDGDGLPDDIEADGDFTGGSFPGPNQPWPGDNNQDWAINNGETWSLLNPMNHDTTYDGVWDGDEDWDNDGVPNLCEVIQGYIESGDPAKYNIYDSGSRPTTCATGPIPATITTAPQNPQRCEGATLTVNYTPNEGPLQGVSPILIDVIIDGTNQGATAMTDVGGSWQSIIPTGTNTLLIEVAFRDSGGTLVDDNEGTNYATAIGECVGVDTYFTMDGVADSTNYLVHGSDMYLWAAVKDQNLYLATWSANGGGSDHFLYATDEFGDPEGPPWAKAGQVWFDKDTQPYLAAESAPSGGFHGLSNGGTVGRAAMGASGQQLEGEFNLAEVFGSVPETVFLAAAAFGDNDGDGLASQGPFQYNAAQHSGDNIEITEFQPVAIDSIRDENLDGHYDAGRPVLETEVNGNRRDANYDLRRFFLDELAGNSASITFYFSPNTSPGDAVTEVELITNLNRRDFVTLEYDLDSVTAGDRTRYFRAYPMAESGGEWSTSLPVEKCGAYRATVRYTVNGNTYYYTDYAQRRDLAIVVSPKRVLTRTMYELNPMVAEATNSTFFGRSTFADMVTVNTDRPDVINPDYFTSLGVNCVWLQPIHPIGSDGRQTDPETGQPYDPGSPFAISDFWTVNSVLGDPATEAQALTEFQTFVSVMDGIGVDVMMDAPFNHSAFDCQIGEIGVDLFPWATDPDDLIRDLRPEWYSNKTNYGDRATIYQSSQITDIGFAPDRFDFGKWNDVADFNFGRYDSLVQGQSDRWRDQYLSELDRFDGHDTQSLELWKYFAEYTLYWLERTGHPEGTDKADSSIGIDGLRCDFAQGMPAIFWEYVINSVRATKWDFYFMAESLDGFATTADGNVRHGLSYRSARHFDIMNENILFYWRGNFFAYPANGPGSAGTPNRATSATFNAFDIRRQAYDLAPLLNAMTTHDEVFPSDDPYDLITAYAQMAAMDGIPLLLYGMEAGAQNDVNTYGFTGNIPNDDHNWDKYELNFGKSIPNFKRYNNMRNVWNNRDIGLQALYSRINEAKLDSPALQSQQNYFLARTGGGSNEDIFAVARFQEAGISAAQQDVVFALVNNDKNSNPTVGELYDLDVEVSPGVNWFGIQPTHEYAINDLVATNPAVNVWGSPRTGQDLIDNGLFVGLPYQGQQMHYLKLVDLTEAPLDADNDGLTDRFDPDDDNDSLPDDFELAGNLDPTDPTGVNGADGDKDGDGASNYDEMIAGTDPDDAGSVLEIAAIRLTGANTEVDWDAVAGRNYVIEKTGTLPGGWQPMFFGTAFGPLETVIEATGTNAVQHYRARVKP